MDPSHSVFIPPTLERLPFDNVILKKLPVEISDEKGPRTVNGACFSRIHTLQPLVNPIFVAVSQPALTLLGLNTQDVLSNLYGPEYFSGSKLLPGSEPAAHCYSGHQFGLFAGQLGDGAVIYLGEVEGPTSNETASVEPNTCGRWEIQVKGGGVTPYSR